MYWNVLGLAMRMFPPQRRYHPICDTLSAILQHFTLTKKPSDPLLLADVTLRCGMYPADQVDIS